MSVKLIMLKYQSVDTKALRRLWKVAKGIVAGCERRWAYGPPKERETTARATLRKGQGLILLHVRPQLAMSADWWMRTAAQSEWSDCATHNLMQLILRCKGVLYPEHGPNGGFAIRNGAPCPADGVLREASPCRGAKVQ